MINIYILCLFLHLVFFGGDKKKWRSENKME